jgi:hypothetical protein
MKVRRKCPDSETIVLLKRKDINSHKLLIAEQQDFICPLCGADMACHPSKKWHLDHDHSNGMIRGALCSGCNRAEGKITNIISRFLSKIDIGFEAYVMNMGKYQKYHALNPSYVRHPDHSSFQDKRIKSLRKAKEKRNAKKAAKKGKPTK